MILTKKNNDKVVRQYSLKCMKMKQKHLKQLKFGEEAIQYQTLN